MDPGEVTEPAPAEPAAPPAPPPRPMAPSDADADAVFAELVEKARAAGLAIQLRESAMMVVRPAAQRVLGVRHAALQIGVLREHES